jgi:hypothetical protein
MDHTTCDSCAALIFQSLEFNTTLEYVQLGPKPDEADRDDDDDDDDDCFSDNSPGLEQLIQSLPRMSSNSNLQRLGVTDWESYIYHAGFVAALEQNHACKSW